MTDTVLASLFFVLTAMSLAFGLLLHWKGTWRWGACAALCLMSLFIHGYIIAEAPPFFGPALLGAFFFVTILPAVLGWGAVVLFLLWRGNRARARDRQAN